MLPMNHHDTQQNSSTFYRATRAWQLLLPFSKIHPLLGVFLLFGDKEIIKKKSNSITINTHITKMCSILEVFVVGQVVQIQVPGRVFILRFWSLCLHKKKNPNQKSQKPPSINNLQVQLFELTFLFEDKMACLRVAQSTFLSLPCQLVFLLSTQAVSVVKREDQGSHVEETKVICKTFFDKL